MKSEAEHRLENQELVKSLLYNRDSKGDQGLKQEIASLINTEQSKTLLDLIAKLSANVGRLQQLSNEFCSDATDPALDETKPVL